MDCSHKITYLIGGFLELRCQYEAYGRRLKYHLWRSAAKGTVRHHGASARHVPVC